MFSTGSAWTSPVAATTCASARQDTAARDASTSPASGNSSSTLSFSTFIHNFQIDLEVSLHGVKDQVQGTFTKFF
jgi:hypothetical protein